MGVDAFRCFYYGESPTNTAQAYCALLRDIMSQVYEPGQAFLQNGAPIPANVTKDLLDEMGIWVIEHPPYSPDLNVIEHLLPTLKDLTFELKNMRGGKYKRTGVLKTACKACNYRTKRCTPFAI